MNLEITEQIIPHIEKAIGFNLYDHQVDYLLDKGRLQSGRRTGKTAAYCIKLTLSNGKPLDMKRLSEFSDFGDGSYRYINNFFKKDLMGYRDMLKDYGFPVRRVEF